MIHPKIIPDKDATMAEPQLRRMTQDEFFAWQARQEQLYELVDGVPVLPLKMMTGASQAHDRVVVNIIVSLGNQLCRGSCRPTTSDLAIRMPAGNIRRPDVAVEYGQAGRRDMALVDPRVIVEVLSPTTMTFDRIRKIPEYQTIASISHILLIDTESPRLDLWSRDPEGTGRRANSTGLKRVSSFRPSPPRFRLPTCMRESNSNSVQASQRLRRL
jgi:Uma2 family endonuclease